MSQYGIGEIIHFLRENRSTDIISINDEKITFAVRTHLDNFIDVDIYETCRSRKDILEDIKPFTENIFMPLENRRRFLDALIINRKFGLLTCAVYDINAKCYVSAVEGFSFPDSYGDYLPNYKVDRYGEFGYYELPLRRSLNDGDIPLAIDLCIMCTKSVYICDLCVEFIPMMRNVFNTAKRCIELPDGSHVTPEQAMKWLNKHEEESK